MTTTTLELMIEDLFKKKGYMYNEATISAASDYIEMYNTHKDEDEPTMTPASWLKMTEDDYPECVDFELITKESLMYRIADYFVKQRRECIDQTGCLPCYDDFVQTMECDDYRDQIGGWAPEINITDFINFLLDYYEGN